MWHPHQREEPYSGGRDQGRLVPLVLLDSLGRPSAQRILPELQHLAEGRLVPVSPDGTQGMAVHSMVAQQSMVWVDTGRGVVVVAPGRVPRRDHAADHSDPVTPAVASDVGRVLSAGRGRGLLDGPQDAAQRAGPRRATGQLTLPCRRSDDWWPPQAPGSRSSGMDAVSASRIRVSPNSNSSPKL